MQSPNNKKRALTLENTRKEIGFKTQTPKHLKHLMGFSDTKTHQLKNNKFYPSQSSKLDQYVGSLSVRASGRVNRIPPPNQPHETFDRVQTMESYVKESLKSLNYRQKLSTVESLIKSCQQLCHRFGYFYITCAMLFFNPHSQTKLSVWIHPDLRVAKVLHPITKKKQYQKEIEFISNLKLILKQFFPTMYLGNSKTFVSLLIHLNELKAQLFAKNKKSKTQYIFYESKPQREVVQVEKAQEKRTLGSKYQSSSSYGNLRKNTTLKIPRTITEEREPQEDDYGPPRKTFREGKKYDWKENQKYFNNIIPYSCEPKHPLQENNWSKEPVRLEQLAKISVEESTEEAATEDHAPARKARSNNLEDELENLFGSNDFAGGLYDGTQRSQASNKNSMIQRMADQFNSLF